MLRRHNEVAASTSWRRRRPHITQLKEEENLTMQPQTKPKPSCMNQPLTVPCWSKAVSGRAPDGHFAASHVENNAAAIAVPPPQPRLPVDACRLSHIALRRPIVLIYIQNLGDDL